MCCILVHLPPKGSPALAAARALIAGRVDSQHLVDLFAYIHVRMRVCVRARVRAYVCVHGVCAYEYT